MATSISATQDGSAKALRRLRIAALAAMAFAFGNALWAAWDQGLDRFSIQFGQDATQ